MRTSTYFCIIFITLFLSSCRPSEPKVCADDACFKVSIADTPDKRQHGLMQRDHLPADEGMLFIFEKQDLHAFWMKETLIPLDMIWMDEDGRVVDIEAHAPPCNTSPCHIYVPENKARYVLELNAGTTETKNITIGSKLEIIFDR